jgi:hypothetical protein
VHWPDPGPDLGFPDGKCYVCSYLFDTELYFARMRDGQVTLNQGPNEFDLFTRALTNHCQAADSLPAARLEGSRIATVSVWFMLARLQIRFLLVEYGVDWFLMLCCHGSGNDAAADQFTGLG